MRILEGKRCDTKQGSSGEGKKNWMTCFASRTANSTSPEKKNQTAEKPEICLTWNIKKRNSYKAVKMQQQKKKGGDLYTAFRECRIKTINKSSRVKNQLMRERNQKRAQPNPYH